VAGTVSRDNSRTSYCGRSVCQQQRQPDKGSASTADAGRYRNKQESTTSSRKTAANRKNSLKSTGPITPQGKRRVAQNAIRHGFFSQCLLVKHPDGKEDEGEYAAFYAALRKHYEPMDWLEELWVEKIAVWSWRLRRLIRCESGQISKALADHGYEIQQSKAADSENPGIAPLANPEMDAMTDHLFLPSNEDLERLLRYEAMISRQLNHAIAELERLQARRHGSTSGQVS